LSRTPLVNPLSGPAYVLALRNALEQRPTSQFQSPPRTGGTQISIRLPDFILGHIEAITAKSGWNRSEVIDAVLQRGLFDLYAFIEKPKVAEELINDVAAKLAPPHPPAAE
jgi:hypothetical protein